LPEQPDEIASQIRECEKLGAAIVHVHGRDEHGENDASRRQDVNIANGSPLTLRSRQAVKASLRGSIVAFATRCIALSNPSYWRNRTSPAAYSVSGRYRHCHRKPCSTSSIIPPKTVKSVSTLASDTNARWRRSLRFLPTTSASERRTAFNMTSGNKSKSSRNSSNTRPLFSDIRNVTSRSTKHV